MSTLQLTHRWIPSVCGTRMRLKPVATLDDTDEVTHRVVTAEISIFRNGQARLLTLRGKRVTTRRLGARYANVTLVMRMVERHLGIAD